jgi:hypothetical protein
MCLTDQSSILFLLLLSPVKSDLGLAMASRPLSYSHCVVSHLQWYAMPWSSCGRTAFFYFFIFIFIFQQFITWGSLAVHGQHIQTLSTLRLCYAVPIMYYQNLRTSFWRANAGRSPRIFQCNGALSSGKKVETPPTQVCAHSSRPLDSTQKVP